MARKKPKNGGPFILAMIVRSLVCAIILGRSENQAKPRLENRFWPINPGLVARNLFFNGYQEHSAGSLLDFRTALGVFSALAYPLALVSPALYAAQPSSNKSIGPG